MDRMLRGPLAVLLAVVLAAACLAVPARADGLSDAQARERQALASWQAAQRAVQAAKPARDKAKQVLDQGAVGYFRARGVSDAVRLLTDHDIYKKANAYDYPSAVSKSLSDGEHERYAKGLGISVDDTVLPPDIAAMLDGLDSVATVNRLRAKEGRSPDWKSYNGADFPRSNIPLGQLQVTDIAMAAGIIFNSRSSVSDSANHYYDVNSLGHGEIICGAAVESGCYAEEKNNFQTRNGNEVGHYGIITDPDLHYAGGNEGTVEFFETLNDLWVCGDTTANSTPLKQGRVMSVEDYRKDVEAYYAPLKRDVDAYRQAVARETQAHGEYTQAKTAREKAEHPVVSYDTADGRAATGVTADYGKPVARPADPRRTGWVFDGWTLDGKPYDFTRPVTRDITLKATWHRATMTVTYDTADGRQPTSTAATTGKPVARPADPVNALDDAPGDCARWRYRFDGWTLDGRPYDFTRPVTRDITLKATWTLQYPVRFLDQDSHGMLDCSVRHPIQWVADGGKATKPRNPVRDGYTFTRWNIDQSDRAYDFNTPVHDETILAAGWTAKPTQPAKPDKPATGSTTMYRLYNRYTGEHFYTGSTRERDALTACGWTYERVGWTAPAGTDGTPVYRLYNPYAPGGDHHYTMSVKERDTLVRLGWRYEGVGWRSKGATRVWREYNPNAATGTHNYTTSKAEHDALVRLGWRAEGVAWYALS